MRDLPDWTYQRPSTTVVGSFAPEVIAAPGYRKAGGYSRQNEPGSVATTVEERLELMGYPRGFQIAGNSKGKVALQIGNAVPPPVARAVLAELWGDHD